MKPKSNSLLSRVDTRLAACAAAATASLAVPAIADAQIVYSGPVNINIPSTTAGVYLNVVTGANSPSPGSAPGWDVNPWGSSSLSFFNPAAPAGGVYVIGGGTGTSPANLPFGTLIGAANPYGSGAAAITGAFTINLNSTDNIFGFRFVDPTVNGGLTTYGWMRISLAGTSGAQPRSIVEYAYERSGGDIAAGAIPEPTTFALLGVMAAGALGVREWRKRKAA